MITHFIQQFCTIQMQSFNMLFFVIGNNLAMNFQVLADRIKKIKFDGLSLTVRKQIVELHEDFTKLEDLARDFNELFSFMLDINFCLYIIMTGAYSIQLVKSDEISKRITAAFSLLALYVVALLLYGVGENISREVRLQVFLNYNLSICSLECPIG
jgi:hypothetical protein